MENRGKLVALIPARSGSRRIIDKNIKRLNGHPLIAYTISAALESGVFDRLIVSTDDPLYADIARYYGAEAPFLRSKEISGSMSPDVEWVSFSLSRITQACGEPYDNFGILRPTSPFRRSETIVRAWNHFCASPTADSIRTVELIKQNVARLGP